MNRMSAYKLDKRLNESAQKYSREFLASIDDKICNGKMGYGNPI